MDPLSEQRTPWEVARRQHGVITCEQLQALGYDKDAIKHRVARGRLHPKAIGVYAVGRPTLTRHGIWTAAVLSCGRHAVLSHGDAAALWGIAPKREPSIHVSIPLPLTRRRPGVVVHRRAGLSATTHQG